MSSIIKRDKSEIISVSRKIEIANSVLEGINRKFKRILIVDGNEDAREILQEALLYKFGGKTIEVYTSKDGRAAIDSVKNKNGNIDLIITRLRMPEMDGFELIKKIKSNYDGIKILVMGVHISESMKDRAFSIGVDDVYRMPVNLSELYNSVKSLLNI